MTILGCVKGLRVTSACVLSTVVMVASVGPVGASTAEGEGSPNQVLSAAFAAARAEPAVDVTFSVHDDLSGVAVIEAGRVDGLELVTFHQGTKSGKLSVVLIGGLAYLRGNQFGLQSGASFTATAGTDESDRWIVVSSHASSKLGHELFEEVAGGITVSSLWSQLVATGLVSFVPATKVDGQSVVGVRATTSATPGAPIMQETLYLRSTGRPLPVEEIGTGTASFTAVFGPWGKPPVTHAPASALPFKTSWLTGG